MAKSRGIIIIGGLALLSLGGIWAYTRWRGNEADKAYSVTTENQIVRPNNPPASRLTADEATELLAETNDEQSQYDMYKEYNANNMIFADMEAPFNQGTESLYSFVERFGVDEEFQRERTALLDGASTLEYGLLTLSISDPDSTNFFAAWHELSPNEASFCKGFLGSEMIEEYIFSRHDSQSPWQLIDYFRADDTIY